MSPKRPPSETLRSWLDSAEGLAAMTAAARRVVDALQAKRLHGALDRMGIGARTPVQSAVDEVRGELYCFVLENAERLAPALAAVQTNAGRYLVQVFINHCRDLERGPRGDPFRSCYRHVAEALRRDGRFFTEKNPGGGIRYSLAPENRAIAPLADEDLAAIVPEASLVSESSDYLALARYFWQSLQPLFGGATVWVPLRELIRWLRHHGFLVAKETTVSLDQDAIDLPAPSISVFDAERVKRWAVMFANTLASPDRRLWYLRFGRDLGFKAIADQMGYCWPSGAHARVKRLQQMLCDFIQNHDLPWLAADDIDEEAWAVFYEALLAAVENSADAPSGQGKAPPSNRSRPSKDRS